MHYTVLNTSLWWVLPTLFSVIVGSREITVISPEKKKKQVVEKKSLVRNVSFLQSFIFKRAFTHEQP